MIGLAKGPAPSVLVANFADWTKVLVDKAAKNEVPTKTEKGRYGHSDIKAALVAETHGKCAYCESKLRHITYGDIEHIVPKSTDVHKWFEWENLTLACDVCNTLKSDYVGDHDTFIDPYKVDPEEHFWQLGPLVQPRPGSEAAAKTERLLDLNRAELVERRHERLKSLMRHLDVIQRTEDEDLRVILFEDFKKESASDREYAALARDILRRFT